MKWRQWQDKTLSWYEIMIQYIHTIYQKSFTKALKKNRLDAYSPDVNPRENIWSIIKSKLNQISTSKIS